MTSDYDDQSDREDAVRYLLEAGIADSVIENTQLARLFSILSGEVIMYERTSFNLIPQWITNELANNTHGMRDFLLSVTDDGVPIHLVITATLI